MSVEIAVALIVMLVLLFMKVPVFLSVIAGSAVYFFMNPAVGSMILAQRLVSAVQSSSLLGHSVFRLLRRVHELFRCNRRIMALCDILTGRCGAAWRR